MTMPRITGDAWGRIDVDGQTYKDAKLWPGGARAWDWNETGTDHERGVQPRDVEEVLEHGAQYVIIGCGRNERLRVHADTQRLLDEHGVRYESLETGQAIARYRELQASDAAVGALIHTTC
jgi:hypothetical protein